MFFSFAACIRLVAPLRGFIAFGDNLTASSSLVQEARCKAERASPERGPSEPMEATMSRFFFTKSVLVAVTAATIVAAGPAAADPDHYHYHHDNGHHYGQYKHDRYDARYVRENHAWRGHDGRYYCHRSDGTTGLLIGGVGGAVAGGAIGGDALGALVGAGAGALIGRSIDRGSSHCR
jgi:hypothetical protein